MKVNKVLFSQALRYFTVSGLVGGNVYGVNLVRAFEKRYGFLEGPKTVEDYNLERGITFLHGFFQNRVVIDRCQIFQNGIIVESKAAVEEWENFIDDLTEWVSRDASIQMVPWPNAAYGYHSQLEVVCKASLGAAINRFSEITKLLSAMLQSYGQISSVFEPSSISFHTELSAVPYPKPAAFTFARREEQPYSSNIYFSAAPLKTGDHIKLLETFEKVLT